MTRKILNWEIAKLSIIQEQAVKKYNNSRAVMKIFENKFKNFDISIPTKIIIEQEKVFPVTFYGIETWILKKQDRKRIDAFELCCWRRLKRIP